MQEQENSVLKSMKLKVVVLKIFRFWSKNGQSCKNIIWTKSALLKLLKNIFDVDKNWTRLRSVTEMHNPRSPQLESCP